MKNLAKTSAFDQAIQAYNRGDYLSALPLFETAHKRQIQQEISLRNKGLCEFKLRRFAAAIETLNQARRALPGDAMLLEALGLSHVHLRSFEGAVSPLIARLIQPGELSMSTLEGLVAACKFGQQLDHATHLLKEKLLAGSGGDNARISLARILSECAQREQAIATLQAASDWAQSVSLLTELGRIEKDYHKFQDAEKYWLMALKIAEQAQQVPICEQLLRELLKIHAHAGQASGIRQICNNLLKAFPTDENRIQCLAAYVEKALTGDAEQMISLIQDTTRYEKEILIAKARIARDKQDIPAAVGYTLNLLQQNPDDAFMVCNLGLLMADTGQPQLAAACYERALQLRPDYHMAKWNLAIAHFLQGNYAQAFEFAEARWNLEHLMGKRPRAAPELQKGERIAGLSLLVYYEQGLGDSLQFCRFANTLAEYGARITLLVQAPLKTLLTNSFPNLSVISPQDPTPTVDRQVALLSIPYLINSDTHLIPAPHPYLKPTTERVEFWKKQLPKNKMPKVGIAWSGSSTHKNDHNRSIGFEQLATLFTLPIQFVAVQKDIPAAIAPSDLPKNLYVCGEHIQDFNDTAQLMSLLDLVISVDSSPAHLAGATARPTWLLLPRPCDWRWKSNGADSVWYQHFQIYRQDYRRQWTPVIASLREQLIKTFNL